MRKLLNIVSIFCFLLMASCGNGEEKKDETFKLKGSNSTNSKSSNTENVKASKRVDLVSKGIGPVKSIELEDEVDMTMAEVGANVFKQKCTACHRVDKKFIGPPSVGILERRTPEWVMNMILNPEEMLKKDPIAKALLIEFYNAPMINQNLTHDEARAILEYYRTLK